MGIKNSLAELPQTPSKGIVLLSGGLDSTVLLAHCLSEGHDMVGLCMYYGQRHVKEIEAAKAVADYYEIDLIEMDLGTIFKLDGDCTLLGNSHKIPKGEYKNGEVPSTYVPFRNGLFLATAASIALQLGASFVVFGAHANDAAAAYPDCTVEFATAIAASVAEGTARKVSVHAPFIMLTKGDIVECGIDLEVPFGITWSCYEGGDKPCGKCATCLDRAKAFKANGIMKEADYDKQD